jgi:zinc protease
VKPEDLAFTKSAIGQRDALSYETPIQKAAFIGRIQQYNLPTDYVEKQNKILQGMTKSEIDALAKKWIDTDRMNILLVGDKAKILPGLQKTGYEIVELDVEGNPKK